MLLEILALPRSSYYYHIKQFKQVDKNKVLKAKIRMIYDEHTAALDPKTSDMVMQLTKKVVEEQELTTLMITHNMEHAIEYGNRLVMLYHGKIVVDVRGEEKKNLTVAQLIDLFHKNSGQVLNDDALVLG